MRRLFLKSFIQAFIMGGAVLTVCTLLWVIRHQPSLASVRVAFKANDRAILDRNGQVIDEIQVHKDSEGATIGAPANDQARLRRLNWVEYDRLPANLIDAVLTAEDRRFYFHLGFDPGGGETITMQLISKIDPRPGVSRLEKILRALALETAWRKRDILEAYINLSVYRGELQGIAAASRALFDKAPIALTRSEGAVLAALIHSPTASVPFVYARACQLLAQMDVPLECTEISRGHLAYLEESYQIRPFLSLAPFVAQRLASTRSLPGGGLIRSTLDRQLQWQALHAIQSRGDETSAAIVIENSTGNVLAYASPTRDQDQVRLLRQADSALLPLIYARAIDERVITAATAFKEQSVRAALKSKAGVAAVRVLDELGVDNFVYSIVRNGFTGIGNADSYGPSLALGAIDVRLIEVANAYRTLANEGEWSPLRFSPHEISEEVPRRVFSPQAAFIVTDILASANRTGQPWRAVHEGEMTIGFSERYTVAVVGGLKLWAEIADRLERPEDAAASELVAPEGVVYENGEWYLSGTEPSRNTPSPARASFIAFPQKGSIIAIEDAEGDRPTALTTSPFFIQVAEPQPDQNLYLNGRRLGRAVPRLPWEPESGHFLLELRNSRGQTVHKVDFEVRGRRFAEGSKRQQTGS